MATQTAPDNPGRHDRSRAPGSLVPSRTTRSSPQQRGPVEDDEHLQRIVAGLVAGGFRGSEQRLRMTARKRLRTAERHLLEARRYRDNALAAGFPESEGYWTLKARISEIRSAEKRCAVTREVKGVAMALAPSWRGSTDDLLFAAAAVARPVTVHMCLDSGRELSAKRSLAEARRYRELVASWRSWSPPETSPTLDRQYQANIRAALAHEVWAEHLLGRLTWDEFIVADKLLPDWQGEDLPEFVHTIRALTR